jgi:hypothetical protein
VAIDRLIPPFFAKGYGALNEPRNALLLTYVIAQAGIMIGELNVIARIVTIFFILTYGFLNITYAIESWASSDFRPSFKIPRFVSIIGALACIVVMIQLDIIALLAASVVLTALFLFLKRKEFTLQTGDTWNSVWTSLVKSGLGRLTISSRDPRNWRPNVILFSGGELNRPHLVEMGKTLVGKLGIFTNFELIEDPNADQIFKEKETEGPSVSHKKQGVFTRIHRCKDIYQGIDLISRVYGFSGFEPNTVLMGWGARTRDPKKFAQLIETFKKQDFNIAFLSYNTQAQFGNYKQIDFWWTNSGRNLSLALTLLRFITSSKEWRNAKIRIMVINQDNSQAESLYQIIYQLLDKYRLTASVKVINNGVEQLPESGIMKAESTKTDLAIIELPYSDAPANTGLVEKTSHLLAENKTCLLIRSSSFFEEVNISPRMAAEIPEEEVELKPISSVLPNLRTASREIIANEVYNAGQSIENITLNYFSKAFEEKQEGLNEFFEDIKGLSEKIFDQLHKTIKNNNVQNQPKAFLRILNDFSYHSQKQIQHYKQTLIKQRREQFQLANELLVKELTNLVEATPPKLRIKLLPSDFIKKPDDRFFVRFKKFSKKAFVKITGRELFYKLELSAAARYFLRLKRLEATSVLMNDFALNSFGEVAALRKIFSGLHGIIELTRLETKDSTLALERISHEKSRIKAQIGVLEGHVLAFRQKAGAQLLETLLADLQQFSDYIDSAEADNKLKNQISYALKKPEKIEDPFIAFPENWEKTLELFINKAILDFVFLWLRSRIDSKIRKYHQDFSIIPEMQLMRPLKKYKENVMQAIETVNEAAPIDVQLDHSLLKPPDLLDFYDDLFAEITELIAELPEKMEISSLQASEQIGKGQLPESDHVEVSVRKLAGFYLNNLLVDRIKTIGRDTGHKLHQSVLRIKDLVRLINFSLNSENFNPESNEEVLDREKTNKLLQDFVIKLKTEENKIKGIIEKFYQSFDEGLKLACEPLSSAVINQSSLELKKKMRSQGGSVFSRKIKQQVEIWKSGTQKNLVNLLYSKSESIVWASRFEKSQTCKLSNRNMLSFIEAITPKPEVIKDLPYFYSTLFSGMSGTSNDFWVGMSEQIAEGSQAISRFKLGYFGALIITGDRSSGKSSLSKHLARKHFSPDNTYYVRAPKSCQANVVLFREALTNALKVQNQNLDDVFSALPAGKSIIIHDLELWWERKPGGLQVIELIKNLINKYGNKFLFIINANEHALKVIEKSCGIMNYALAAVVCKPFDARELHDIIMLRHYAGGLKFVYNRKEEDKMTALDFARVFNRYFDQSFGNPGLIISLWLASIKKTSGQTLVMNSVEMPSKAVFDLLNQEQLFYLLQFVLHRRLTIDALARNLQFPEQEVKTRINNLVRAGILIEKFEGTFAIQPTLDLFLVEKLKRKNLL